MRFGEKCPCGCGYVELKNWRPVFGPDAIIYAKDVIEAAEVPELATEHRCGDTWTDEYSAYHLSKTGKWLYRLPISIYKAEGNKWPAHSGPKFGTSSEHTEKKRSLIRQFAVQRADKKNQTKLIEVQV